MTDVPAAPPPGWYPHPERVGALLYWDGAAWVQPPPVLVPQGTPVTVRSFVRLSKVVGAGLRLSGLVLVGQMALFVWGIGMFDEAVASGDVETLTRFDDLNLALVIAFVVVFLLTGITWTVWQYQVAGTVAPGELRHGPGMHAGSWYIPLANLVIPCQNVRDLWGNLLGTADKTRVNWWWATLLIGGLVSRIGDSSFEDATTVDDFNESMVFYLVANLFQLVGAVLAISIVRRLTLAGLERSATLTTPAIPGA
ncbi:DUF4328 domain-containing protein [Nocardioides marmoriginsengisoli]|uniref:DUF4328 domain-containing protein n=1 Tax=Nocardioides marmoriginsengisoli TaxID=661483 RepID=A0A3N0CJW6_9ACTN|nr:DUF4328 domain-containing protein [Nocardioides marmoriginsengisoli]RNL63732.1 DUF4328 domain-containing protein [Nocardioides marmoriginsengisoli]